MRGKDVASLLEPFEAANETEIVVKKLDFLWDGGDFLYLRKGEDVGAVEVALEFINILQQAADYGPAFAPWVGEAGDMLAKVGGGVMAAGAVAAAVRRAWKYALDELEEYKDCLGRTKALLKKTNAKGEPIDFEEALGTSSFPVPKDLRIICNRDAENEKAIALFRLVGARIRHRPKKVSSGTHRFYLNDRRCALFFRLPNKTFIGVNGPDAFLQERLKKAFLEEWEQFAPDVEE